MSILTEIQTVLDTYYDVKLTENQILDVFINVQKWTKEIQQNGVFDTESRRYIINSVCIYMGMRNMWPMYRDLPSYEKAFHAEFQAKLKEFGFNQ